MTASGSDQPHRYFFVHIMRTGGVALRRRLMNHFGDAAVYPTRGLDGTNPVKSYLLIDYLRERLEARGDQIRVITGHFPLRTVELIDGRFTTLTLLRDPVERTLSRLRQVQQEQSFLERRARASRRAGKPLEEIYELPRGVANNNMTKMLSLTPEEMSASMFTRVELDRDHLERAKEALAGIDAFGLQERFEDFCERLAARFGWQLGEPDVVNATARVDAPKSLRARIAEDNALDVELYEFAKVLIAS
jgi:Sulfotransferase family